MLLNRFSYSGLQVSGGGGRRGTKVVPPLWWQSLSVSFRIVSITGDKNTTETGLNITWHVLTKKMEKSKIVVDSGLIIFRFLNNIVRTFSNISLSLSLSALAWLHYEGSSQLIWEDGSQQFKTYFILYQLKQKQNTFFLIVVLFRSLYGIFPPHPTKDDLGFHMSLYNITLSLLPLGDGD